MIHEAGHAFHSFYSGHLDLVHERDSPIEFAEVASMSMELLTHPEWEKFYDEIDSKRAKKKHLQGIIEFMPWMATIDSFQHWIYHNPQHTRDERSTKWLEKEETMNAISILCIIYKQRRTRYMVYLRTLRVSICTSS